MPQIPEQVRLKALAMGQRMKERTAALAVQDIRQRIADGDPVPRLVRDAANLPPAVLALPVHYDRFMTLYSDFIA